MNDKLFYGLAWSFLGALCLATIDNVAASLGDAKEATVVGKVYTPRTTSYGTGLGTDSKGGTVVVSTSETTPEKWVILVNHKSKVFSVQSSPSAWATAENGNIVNIQPRLGLMSGICYGWVCN